MSNCITPFSLKDAPALIERLLPVQKLSAVAYKEQMAGSGKTLTALGSYWNGRKPLILARKLETQRPDEASAARILRELVKHQRLG
jgi:adenine-specific DNA methylase